MAENMRTERLKTLLADAAARGAAFVWLEQEFGVVLGERIGEPAFFVDIGRERLVPLKPDRVDASHARQAWDAPPAAIWPDAAGGRRTGDFVLTLEGRRYAARSQKQLLLVGLQAIERVRPGSLEKLSREKARTKRVVSRERTALNQNPKLAAKFSERIDGGWWVFTNNSFAETEKFLLRAASYAGLHARVEKLS